VAVKLYRCSNQWVKFGGHPCWRVEKALIESGVEYERVPGPYSRGQRTAVTEGTGQSKYPAIQFEDGVWYREESKEMAATIRAGALREKDTGTPAAAPVH
jgi:hypothetical protein